MGCTSSKTAKGEGDLERFHHEVFAVAESGNVKRLKEILDELDRRKASTTKKDVLNMGKIVFTRSSTTLIVFLTCRLSGSRWTDGVEHRSGKKTQISHRNLSQCVA